MVEAGGLAQTIADMATNKDNFRSEDGLGGAYENPENVSDDTIDAYLGPLTADPQRVADLERFIIAFDNAQTVRVEEDLKKLTAPTLIVWGTGDIFFDTSWSVWLQETIPGSRRRVELDGARLLLLEERPAELNGALREHWDLQR